MDHSLLKLGDFPGIFFEVGVLLKLLDLLLAHGGGRRELAKLSDR